MRGGSASPPTNKRDRREFDSRLWEVPVALTGVAWLIFHLVGGAGPEFGETPAETARLLIEQRSQTARGIYLNLIGASCGLIFIAYWTGRVRRVISDRLEWLASLLLAGGTILVALFLVYEMFWMASISEANDLSQHPYIGVTILQLTWEFGGIMTPATAALVGGSGVAVLVTRLAPRWFGAMGVLVGAAAVLSGFTGGLLSLVGLFWIACLSLTLTLRLLRGRTAAVVAG